MSDAIRAVVQKVAEGEHGLYAIATSPEVKGSITFSLVNGVWQDRGVPDKGMHVMLSDLRRKRAGWRAMSGRFVRPSDDSKQLATNKGSKQ